MNPDFFKKRSYIQLLICAVCYSNNIQGLQTQIESAIKQDFDIIEIRVDGLDEIDTIKLKEIMSNYKKPFILTSRSEWKDHPMELPIIQRKKIITELIKLNPEYIDLEYPIDIPHIKSVDKKTKIVLSLLDFDGIAKIAIDSAINMITDKENTYLKISATPNSISDLKTLWSWSKKLKRSKIPSIVLGMGELGTITRIKSREMNNKWTYARVSGVPGEPLLLGMIETNVIKKAFSDHSWHLGEISLYGDHSARSLVKLYEEIIDKSVLGGVFCNLPIKTKAELDQLLLWIKDGLLEGITILDPWKQDVIPQLDRLDSSVIMANSCNCVVIEKDGLVGYNTEIEALMRIISPFPSNKMKRVYIEGSGFFARSIVSAFSDMADLIVIRGQNSHEVKSLLVDFPKLTHVDDSFTTDYDLVINNQIPEIGFEKISPIPPSILTNSRVIMDLATQVKQYSSTINEANKLNIPFISSTDFFLQMHIRNFELWTNNSVPTGDIDITFLDGNY